MSIEKVRNTELLIDAARWGDTAEVQRLIPLSDTKISESYALQCAAHNGHIECVKLLIPVSGPKEDKTKALICAIYNDHAECVRLLIPLSLTQLKNSEALRIAVEYGQTSCIDLLYPVSDPSAALHQLQQDYRGDESFWKDLEQRIANEQNQKLSEMLSAEVHADRRKIARKM